MKHRLPKAKSATTRLGDKTDLEQSELLIDESSEKSSTQEGSPPEQEAPSSLTPTTIVNETSDSSPDESTSLLAEPPKSPLPDSGDKDSYGLLDNEPAKNPISGISAPLVVNRGNKTLPPPLPEISKPKATPPPLPLPALKVEPPPLEVKEVAPPKTETTPITVPETPVEAPVVADGIRYERLEINTPPDVTEATSSDLAEELPDHQPFLIQTQGLVKQYGGRRVVNGVDIHVKAGEVVGLLGKNGAGKTTTFYMIVGLVPPTLGHVFMGEEDVTHMPMYRRARRGIGYLPQEESIFRKLTVEENLLAILETLPMTEDERENRCDELLKDFGLEHVRENVAITLSGGEKRRVTIARALVTSPSLLLLDEPFSGVDPMAVHDIQEIILHLKERGLGVLITDHNVRETLSVVDRAYIIDEGRVLSTGTREFLLNDPIAREIYLGHRFSM